MRDKDTIEIAMEAAETGHLVLSTLHTIDASKTVERVVGAFPLAEQQIIRTRLAKSFRYIVSQRLLPQKEGGRVAIIEILTSTLRTREYVEKGENEGKTLLDAMKDGETEGMQDFDGSIEKLVRAGVVELETGLAAIAFHVRLPGTSTYLLALCAACAGKGVWDRVEQSQHLRQHSWEPLHRRMPHPSFLPLGGVRELSNSIRPFCCRGNMLANSGRGGWPPPICAAAGLVPDTGGCPRH